MAALFACLRYVKYVQYLRKTKELMGGLLPSVLVTVRNAQTPPLASGKTYKWKICKSKCNLGTNFAEGNDIELESDLEVHGDDQEEMEEVLVQLRNKFKKLVSECKKSALAMKSATGIKRFQDQKGYGAWFDRLYALVKTRDSCQPELATEPSINRAVDESALSSVPDDSPGSDSSPPLFVPIKKTSIKKGKGSTDEVVNMLRTSVENDPLKEFLKFVKEEAEKAREHEMKLLQMPMGSQTQPQSTSYQVPTAYQGHAGFQNPVGYPQSQAGYQSTPLDHQNQQNMTFNLNLEENELSLYQNL
eukprot:gene15777-7076_t